jgi:hypothetical protein
MGSSGAVLTADGLRDESSLCMTEISFNWKKRMSEIRNSCSGYSMMTSGNYALVIAVFVVRTCFLKWRSL